MDLYGIGFSNVRMSNLKNDYTHQYNYRANTFPEEVFLHEFLHTLERNLIESGMKYQHYMILQNMAIRMKN